MIRFIIPQLCPHLAPIGAIRHYGPAASAVIFPVMWNVVSRALACAQAISVTAE